MVAAVLHAAGAPCCDDFHEPVEGDGHVVVDVTAAGLNPVDLVLADGALPGATPVYPSVVGREGVGRLPDGRRVYFMRPEPPFGSMAERVLVAREDLFEVGDGVDDVAAVSVGISGLAAWLALAWRAELEPGETVLVLGATGSVGTVAVQAARLLGAGRVVAAGRNEAVLGRVRGADAVVALHGDYAEALRVAVGTGANVIVDALWGKPAAVALRAATAEGARYVQVGNAAGTVSPLLAPPLRAKSVHVLGYGGFVVPHAVRQEAYGQLLRHLAAGRLTLDVETYALADVDDAWERQRAGAGAKLVVLP